MLFENIMKELSSSENLVWVLVGFVSRFGIKRKIKTFILQMLSANELKLCKNYNMHWVKYTINITFIIL